MSEDASMSAGVLHDEHVYLGARFAPSPDRMTSVPAEYSGEADIDHARDGALLSDLSGCTHLLVSGRPAESLCETAFCAEKLAPGEAGFEPALTGEGAVSSIPLVARTAESEYLVLDASERGPILGAWLGFLAGVSQDGYAPYEGVEVENATDLLVPLLLVGSDARRVLGDYLSDASEIPATRQVRRCSLDRIQSFVIGLPEVSGSLPGYVLLVPPQSAVVLWRSLLSFADVDPVGHDAVATLVREELPWGGLLDERGKALASRDELTAWHLIRESDDFIGRRSLS